MKTIIGLLILVFFQSAPTNYYVDPSSTASTQDGSKAYPWKTLAQVNSNMGRFRPGDSILFRRGRTFTGSLVISRSGTSSSPITFAAYGTGTPPVLQYNIAANLSKSISQRAIIYAASGISYITISDIRFTDTTVNSVSIHTLKTANVGYAIDFDGSTSNGCNGITLKNLTISLVGNAIEIHGNGNVVTDCSIYDLGGVKNNLNDEGNFGASGITFAGSNNKIFRNSFVRCWRKDLTFGYDGGAIEQYGAVGGECSNNQIMYNTVIDCDGLTEWGSGTTSDICNNNVLAYNLIINCNQIVILHNNKETISNFQFYNNDVIETTAQFEATSQLFGSSVTAAAGTLILKNNIFWISKTVPNYWQLVKSTFTGSFTHSNNIYRMATGKLGFSLSPTELSVSSSTPLFTSTSPVTPVGWNYNLVSSSPAIDKGAKLGLTLDLKGNSVFSGTAPDIGAIESPAQ